MKVIAKLPFTLYDIVTLKADLLNFIYMHAFYK